MKYGSLERLKTPVLLIGFNRPEYIIQVFSKIREAQPTKLYIVVDGARINKPNDGLLVEKVKEIVQNIDWDCEAYYKFNNHNEGAELTISSAISWVLESEESVIVLEDDIVASISFFKFAEEMLDRYSSIPEITHISGSNFTPIANLDNHDYIFAKYAHTWGWATWRRAWDSFDLNMSIPKEHLRNRFLKTISNTRREMRFLRRKFSMIDRKGIGNSTWDNIYFYNHVVNKKISIVPKANLVSNIGVYGLHAKGKHKHHHRYMTEDFIVCEHPTVIKQNIEYDRYHFNNHLDTRKPIHHRIKNKIKSRLNQK